MIWHFIIFYETLLYISSFCLFLLPLDTVTRVQYSAVSFFYIVLARCILPDLFSRDRDLAWPDSSTPPFD
jgi:hypothetical protein